MFKNMKLAVKIGVGFGLLIVIALILGGLAVVNMLSVKGVATVMQEENVPVVKVANNVERKALLTMYEARGFALAEEDSYKKNAEKHLEEVFTFLKEAQALAKQHEIEKLATAAGEAEKETQEYKDLFGQTAAKIAAMDHDRKQMNESAGKYMDVCAAYLKGQNEKLTKEIESGASAEKLTERVKKVNWVNDVIDFGNAVRVAAWKAQAQRDPKVIEVAMPNFEKIDHTLDQMKAITSQPADKEEIEQCRKSGHAYKEGLTDLVANWTALQAIGKKRGEVADKVLLAAQSTAEFGMTQTSDGATKAASSLSTASSVMMTGLGIAVVVGIVLAVFITRSIVGPIKKVIEGLSAGSEQVTSASGQVSGASQELAQGASEQASSLEETSSALEEMASMTRQNADNANQANATAKQAADLAGTGVESMKRMTEAIDRIKSSASETAKIIKTIDEIAFQTNLLALNAAVEAARAGEAGKGFAVVAEEVRNLARRSAEAAKNTADLIEGSQKNADAGVAVTAEVAKNLSGIKENAGKVATLIAEIAAASKEQSQGIDQVNTAVSEMDKVVQRNAANAEESASASEELTGQSAELSSMVDQLVGIVGGANASGQQVSAHSGKAKALAAHAGGAPRQVTGKLHAAVQPRKAEKRDAPKLAAARQGAAKPEEVIPLDDKELGSF